MKRHADFLGLLYLAWGAIFALVGTAGFALTAGAWAIARGSGSDRVASDLAANVTALTFGGLALLAFVWGLLHLWLGSALGRYQPRARLLALGFALINLVLFPFGTALGAYACWVLLKEEGRALYLGPAHATDIGARPPADG
ncbi:MAG: hypothetical protein ACT4QD_25790 [Acidobacteriota bacterium]